MRIALLLLICFVPVGSLAQLAPTDETGLFLGFSSQSDRSTGLGALSVDVGVGGLSLGRPLLAIDDPRFSPLGFALARSGSHTSEAAPSNHLGAGIPFKTAPFFGLSISGSWHGGQGETPDIVAPISHYEAPELETLGQIAFYGGAETGDDGDVYRLGTSLTKGIANATIDLTAGSASLDRRITGMYLGLDVTDDVSLGLSQEFEQNSKSPGLDPRFGIGAAYTLGRGRVLSGAVGDVTGDDPSFGLLLGLQF